MTGLGDVISNALAVVGITEERVTKWLGKPCGCEERKQRLNAILWWASRPKASRSKAYLEEIIS